MKIKIKYNNFEELNSILVNSNYLNMYSNKYGWICGYEDEKLCYVIPFLEKKKMIFKYIQMQSETININKTRVSEKEFLNLLILKIKQENKIDFISQPKTNVVFDTYPDNSLYSSFGSYIIDLSLNEDELFKNIHTKHKNVIKRAIKNDVVVEFGTNIFDDAYSVIFKTLQRNNMSMIGREKLLKLLNTNEKNFLIGCSYLENKSQGAVIILYDNYKGYYFWGGTSTDLSLGSNNLLHWEVIKKLKSLNVEFYDFVGARINTEDTRLLGIQRFKNRFGATLKEGYLWKYPLKIWKYKLFTYLYNLKMKKGDIIDQEKNNINL